MPRYEMTEGGSTKATQATKPAKAGKPAKATKPGKAGKPAKATKPAKPAKATEATVGRFVHVGHVHYNAHPASPLVIGDFELMKSWKGDGDARYDNEIIKLAGGTIVNTDLEVKAPDVFLAAPDRIVLLAESNHSVIDSYVLDELEADLWGPMKSHQSWTIEVPSGAIVISIAFNATPEVGADVSELDDKAFDPDDTPMLPKRVPTKPLFTPSRPDLAVVPVPPGRYRITSGETKRFLRCDIAPVGGAKASKPPSSAKPAAKKPAARAITVAAGDVQRLVPDAPAWSGIGAIATGGGRIFAIENPGIRVAAWDEDGALLWQVRPVPEAQMSPYYTGAIELVGEDLLYEYGRLYVLDPKTGKTRKVLAYPRASGCHVAGGRMVLHTSNETTVLTYPAMKPVAVLEQYRDSGIAISPEGTWLAVGGPEVHVFDWKTLKLVTSFEPENSPYAMDFTPGGLLVIGDDKARVQLYEPRSGKRVAMIDAAPDRGRGGRAKPSIHAIATSARLIAASRADGTVALIDGKSREVVGQLGGHAVKDVYAPLDIAFADDGATLWVGAAAKGKPVGVTGYPV